MEEEFRPIANYEGLYEISNLGNCHSVKRGQLLVPTHVGSRGRFYPAYQLSKDGKVKKKMIHRLMAEAFLGSIKGKIVRHLDDDETNFDLSNLAIGTMKDNAEDAKRNGRNNKAFGEDHGNCSHSDETILLAVEEYKFSGLTQRQVAEKHGIGVCYFNDVLHGRRRAYLNLDIEKYAYKTPKSSANNTSLTEEDIREIRRQTSGDGLYSRGTKTLRQVADEFGLSVPTVSSIKNRRTWGWVSD